MLPFQGIMWCSPTMQPCLVRRSTAVQMVLVPSKRTASIGSNLAQTSRIWIVQCFFLRSNVAPFCSTYCNRAVEILFEQTRTEFLLFKVLVSGTGRAGSATFPSGHHLIFGISWYIPNLACMICLIIFIVINIYNWYIFIELYLATFPSSKLNSSLQAPVIFSSETLLHRTPTWDPLRRRRSNWRPGAVQRNWCVRTVAEVEQNGHSGRACHLVIWDSSVFSSGAGARWDQWHGLGELESHCGGPKLNPWKLLSAAGCSRWDRRRTCQRWRMMWWFEPRSWRHCRRLMTSRSCCHQMYLGIQGCGSAFHWLQ